MLQCGNQGVRGIRSRTRPGCSQSPAMVYSRENTRVGDQCLPVEGSISPSLGMAVSDAEHKSPRWQVPAWRGAGPSLERQVIAWWGGGQSCLVAG